MNIDDCYRRLGLRAGASYEDIKTSYRRLARQFHPDANPGDQRAKDQFIQITEAYKFLLTVVKPEGLMNTPPSASEPSTTGTRVTVKVTRKPSPVQSNPNLTFVEQQLKETTYEQLQQLFRDQRFPRAIALVEGLAQRLPQDPEIRQWQAITYQRWGRHLIQERQFDKARSYLKKALRTDPHNRSLWAEVERDFRRMEQLV